MKWLRYQRHVNHITLNRGLCSNFVGYESFLKSNSSDIFALYETNFDDLIDSGNFSVRGYLEGILLLKYMVLRFMWRRDFNLQDSRLYKTLKLLPDIFDWFYFFSVVLLFPLSISLCFFPQVFDDIPYNIDSLNQSICYCICLWRP